MPAKKKASKKKTSKKKTSKKKAFKKKTSKNLVATILASLAGTTSIEEVREFLGQVGQPDVLRGQLLARFERLQEYQDALEWETAVLLCEALAILGWDPRERVDAIAHFNGDHWSTTFVNAQGESRFRSGFWTKRKAGWVLFNPTYHYSPDRPEKPGRDWLEHADEDLAPVNTQRLASQRNYWKQMPITMGVIGGSNPTTDQVASLRRELTSVLKRFLRQNEYGDALEHLYLTLHCPALGEEPCSLGLKVGAFRAKTKSLYCDLSIGSEFGDLALGKQKAVFVSALKEAVSALRKKLAKQKIEYDVDGLSRDLLAGLEAWSA